MCVHVCVCVNRVNGDKSLVMHDNIHYWAVIL